MEYKLVNEQASLWKKINDVYKFDDEYNAIEYAGWHKVREAASSIAKDLIDTEDPKHSLSFCEAACVAIYALFQE